MHLVGAHGQWLGSRHPMLTHNGTAPPSDAAEHDAWIATWIKAVLLRRERLYYVCLPGPMPEVLSSLDMPPHWHPTWGQIQLVEPMAGPGSAPSDDVPPQAWASTYLRWYQELLRHALADGYRGAAFVTDPDARPVLAPTAAHLLAHEIALDALTARGESRALCRYTEDEHSPSAFKDLLRLHRSVNGVTWGVDVTDVCAHLSGRLDATNADPVMELLRLAASVGVTTVDAGSVTLLAAAALGTLGTFASELGRDGRWLTILNPPPLARRTLALGGLLAHPHIEVVPAPESRRTGRPGHPRTPLRQVASGILG